MDYGVFQMERLLSSLQLLAKGATTSSSNGQQPITWTYEKLDEIAQYMLQRTKVRPIVGIVCGYGLSSMADDVTDAQIFEYKDLPNFPESTVEDHVSRMVFGCLEGVQVMVQQGRLQHYEGYSLETCTMPIRVMKLVGVKYLISTKASGGINQKYKIGNIMIIKDHVSFMGFAGNNPLRGLNEKRFGPRFHPMTNAYSPKLIEIAKAAVCKLGIEKEVHVGVYTCVGGPNYETVAELRLLHTLGIDAVGMATAHEVGVARHCDMEVFAFSLITNECPLDWDFDKKKTANPEEVVAVGTARRDVCMKLVRRVVRKIGKDEEASNCQEQVPECQN